MGPLYFLSLRKIHIFGFRIDGEPRQLNFMIDENETMAQDGCDAKGPNAVISMIDWAIENYGGKPASFGIHADNCPGITIYNKSIKYIFLNFVKSVCHISVLFMIN